MLTIRLSRIGKKNKPMYRLIISEKARDPYGRALEILGSYNPYTKDLEAKADRITYWISRGAGTSATVNNLLIEKGIIKGEKVKTVKINTKKRKAKEAKEATPTKDEKPAEGEKKETKDEAPVSTEVPADKPAEEVKTEVPADKPAEEVKVEEKKEEKPAEEEKEEVKDEAEKA